ncbi:MAG TPA: dienelactone hydrolase family protein [Acidimicrobiales bacterium]|nr:dienelactone hydrolase family protein [Acidimicrobiales bacterium]
MATTTHTVTTPDGPMVLTVDGPDGGARRGIVLIQEAFGVNHYIEDVAGRLAEAGYLTAAPHLFHRTGDTVVGYTEYDKLAPHMQALNEQSLLDDVDAAMAWLAGKGIEAQSTGIVGFCMGGTVAFLTAVRRPVGAAVTFYGGGVGQGRFGLPPLIELAPDLGAPWLGLYGDEDKGIPVEDVEALRAAAKHAGVPTEVVRYGDAGHGFHCHARPDYNEGAATDAWSRALTWFDTYLPG